MKFMYRSIRFLLLTALLAAIHFGAASLLPHPYSTINIFFVVFTLSILWSERGSVVWLAFATHFIIELFSTLPFGITLFSAVFATLLGYWLFEAFFTNKSWYTATALSASMIFLYRVLYVFLILFIIFFEKQSIAWPQLFIRFAWEIIFSVAITTLIYFILHRKFIARAERGIFMKV